MTNTIKKMQKSILAIPANPWAIPPNPKIAKSKASTANTMTHCNMIVQFYLVNMISNESNEVPKLIYTELFQYELLIPFRKKQQAKSELNQLYNSVKQRIFPVPEQSAKPYRKMIMV